MTLSGPHRDELRMNINGRDVGLYGSRGQSRTTVMALKLAELRERNCQKSVAEIAKAHGHGGLKPDTLRINFTGVAGQSFGAWLAHGVTLDLTGDANDYVGKGLSGGTIVVRPLTSSPLASNENTIIGNTVLYGATAGKLFAAGQAGERFCVRNSEAVAVVEGCGSNGCEYMTGGVAVILGPVGPNFAAGMSGGMAFIYDVDDVLPERINPESVVHPRVETDYWEGQLRELIAEHWRETQSAFAQQILVNWAQEKRRFWQVVPREMLQRLAHPVTAEAEAAARA